MHFKDDVDVSQEEKDPPSVEWPFLIKGIMENSNCSTPSSDTILALIWTIAAVFGIVYALLGYRCLRAIGFLSGLLVGANSVFLMQDFKITQFESPADSFLAVLGAVFGAVLGSTYIIASALVSAFAGALLAAAAMAVCVATMPDNEFNSREIFVAIAGGAIIFSVLTLCCVKYITILASSIVGSAMIISSIDYFMHGLKTINWLLIMKPNPSPPPCFGGILICSWPVAAIVSVMVQCFITGWRVDHRKRIHYRHHHQRHRSNSRPRESREEARQRKYRYLYQVRTARGDIISQNFVSALQKRVQHGIGTPSEHSIKTSSNERNTIRSDRTHFTNIPDSELGDKIDIVHERGG